MSAQTLVHGVLAAALRADPALAAALTGIFEAPPVRSARPYAVIGEPLVADWGTKDAIGREARVAIGIHDVGEAPSRLRDLMGMLDGAVLGIARDADPGWEIAGVTLVRSRIAREGDGRWAGTSEFRMRILKR